MVCLKEQKVDQTTAKTHKSQDIWKGQPEPFESTLGHVWVRGFMMNPRGWLWVLKPGANYASGFTPGKTNSPDFLIKLLMEQLERCCTCRRLGFKAQPTHSSSQP